MNDACAFAPDRDEGFTKSATSRIILLEKQHKNKYSKRHLL